jgi:hypothetical protein
MRKRYTKRGSVRKPSRKERRTRQVGRDRAVQSVLDREELVAMMQDSLTSFASEVDLETYARFQSPDAMPQSVLKRLVRGVSCRDYAGVVDLAGEGLGSGNRASAARW